MNIKQAKEQIHHAMEAYFTKDRFGSYIVPPKEQRPVFLMGPPGIGKTAIIEQVAQELGVGLVSYSMTHHTRQSALGLPFIVEKEFGGQIFSVSEYTMSEIIASVYDCMQKTGHTEGILFLDEINCVSETLTPAMLQFLQYKTFGRHQVPNGWLVVTAGNPPEYNHAAREFDIVTWDRLKRIDIEPVYSVWKEYACAQEVHPAITTYLDYKNEDFYSVQNTADGRHFVTARGWSDLSKMIRLYEMHGTKVDENLIRQYLQNPEIAKNFAVYYDLYQKYQTDYQVDAILSASEPESIRQRARRAPFDERISLLGLLTDAISDQTDEIIRKEAVYRELGNALRQIRNSLKNPSARPEEVIGRHMERLGREALTKDDYSGSSTAASIQIRSAAAILQDYMRMPEVKEGNGPAFTAWKEDFEKKSLALRDQAGAVSTQLENLFSFCEKVFPAGQELIILVTELTIRPSCAAFIARYGSEGYYRNNSRLQFSLRNAELLEQ